MMLKFHAAKIEDACDRIGGDKPCGVISGPGHLIADAHFDAGLIGGRVFRENRSSLRRTAKSR